MSSWLDPVRRALDKAPAPIPIFFRDDDAGWNDDRLFLLLDLFADHTMPLDIAVIPQALTSALARKIGQRSEAHPELIGVHQHGFAHINHEVEGRKCEFGPSRPAALMERDIKEGRHLLDELLGPMVQPIFTPPWNRCSGQAVDCLIKLGFRVLSRDQSAEPVNRPELFELPVHIDWFGKHRGARLDRYRIGCQIADAMNETNPVGIMFHHAMMDDDEIKDAGELLSLLSSHDRACGGLMKAFVAEKTAS